MARQLAFLAEQVLHQLLLNGQQFIGAAAECGPVAYFIVPGVQVAQHQLDGIQGGRRVAGGRRGTQGTLRSTDHGHSIEGRAKRRRGPAWITAPDQQSPNRVLDT